MSEALLRKCNRISLGTLPVRHHFWCHLCTGVGRFSPSTQTSPDTCADLPYQAVSSMVRDPSFNTKSADLLLNAPQCRYFHSACCSTGERPWHQSSQQSGGTNEDTGSDGSVMMIAERCELCKRSTFCMRAHASLHRHVRRHDHRMRCYLFNLTCLMYSTRFQRRSGEDACSTGDVPASFRGPLKSEALRPWPVNSSSENTYLIMKRASPIRQRDTSCHIRVKVFPVRPPFFSLTAV